MIKKKKEFQFSRMIHVHSEGSKIKVRFGIVSFEAMKQIVSFSQKKELWCKMQGKKNSNSYQTMSLLHHFRNIYS